MRKLFSLKSGWLALGFCGVLGASCVPQAFEQADYKSHLTPNEKTELAAGRTVNKMHSSYWRFHPSQLYWAGPLRVKPLPNGKLKFIPFGNWKQYDEKGGLLCESTYIATDIGSAGHSRMYYPAGFLQAVTDGWVAQLNGDSVLVGRIVQFNGGNEKDTAYVEKRWFKNGKSVRPAVRTLDLQGLRPVPKHYKSARQAPAADDSR